MQSKPIFIGLTAGIVVLVVAVASFFSGLYVGQRGFVADMQYQQQNAAQPGQPNQFQNGQAPQQFNQPANGQAPQQSGQQPQSGLPQGGAPQSGPGAGQPSQTGPNPAGGPPGAPSWPPDVIGRVASITATELVLQTPNGPITITLTDSTQFLNQDGAPASIADFQMGDTVAVFGAPTAATLMELPPRPDGPAPTQTAP